METGHFLDLEGWSRRAHHTFFSQFEQPEFNLCAEVDVSATRAWCKAESQPFSLACWYLCQQVVNSIESFRYRRRGERVWVHDQIQIGSTALSADDAFRFCYYPHREAFAGFVEGARAAQNAPPDLIVDGRPELDALIHGSIVPWVRFTSVSHARKDDRPSPPKIVLGRYSLTDGRWMMPVSVEVDHALMDGLHVGRFFEQFEAHLAAPESHLTE